MSSSVRLRFTRPLVSCAVLVFAAACGGAPPADHTAAAPPAPPAPMESATPAAATAPGTEASAAPAPAETAPPAASSAPAEPEVPSRSLGDRLFAPGIAYMLDYASSGAKETADRTCSAAAGDDPSKKAACMEKERNKILADVLLWAKKDDAMTWTVYRRTGSNLTELWKGKVGVADDGPSRITIQVKSDKGSRPILPGKKEVVVTSASDSSIELEDPRFGKLVYEARIGLVNPP